MLSHSKAHNGLRGIELVPDIELESMPWFEPLRIEDMKLQKSGVYAEYNRLHNHWKIEEGEGVFRERFGRGFGEVEIVRPTKRQGSPVGNSFVVTPGGEMVPVVFSDDVVPPVSRVLEGLMNVISQFGLYGELGFTFLPEPRPFVDEKYLVRVELPGEGDRVLKTAYFLPQTLRSVRYQLTNFTFVCKSECVKSGCTVDTWCLPIELEGGGYSHRQVITHNSGHLFVPT